MYGTCARCGQKGELLARSLHESCYHKALREGTLKNYSGALTEPELPVRSKWEFLGNEAALIAAQEAADLRAEVTRTVFSAFERESNPYGIAASAPVGKLARVVDIGAVQFVVYAEDERGLDAEESALRARNVV